MSLNKFALNTDYFTTPDNFNKNLNEPSKNNSSTNRSFFISKSAKVSPVLNANDFLLSFQRKNGTIMGKSKTEPNSPIKFFNLDHYNNNRSNSNSAKNTKNKIAKLNHNSIKTHDNLFITPFSSPLFEKDLIQNDLSSLSKNINNNQNSNNDNNTPIILPKLNNPSKTKELPTLSHLKLLPDRRIQNNSYLYPDTSEITPLWKNNLINWCKDSNYQDYMTISKQKKLINVNNNGNKLLSNFDKLPSSILKPGDQFKELTSNFNSKKLNSNEIDGEEDDTMTPITPPLSPKRSLENLKFTPFVSEKLIQSVKISSNTDSNETKLPQTPNLIINNNTGNHSNNNYNSSHTNSKRITKNGHKKTNSFKALQIKKMLYNRDIFASAMVLKKRNVQNTSKNVDQIKDNLSKSENYSLSDNDNNSTDTSPTSRCGTKKGQIILKLDNKIHTTITSSGKFEINSFSNNNFMPTTIMGTKNVTNTDNTVDRKDYNKGANNINSKTNTNIITNVINTFNLTNTSSHRTTRDSSNSTSKKSSNVSTRSNSPIRNFVTPSSRSTSPIRQNTTFQNNSLPKYHKFTVSSRSPSPIRLQRTDSNNLMKNNGTNNSMSSFSPINNINNKNSQSHNKVFNYNSSSSSTTNSPKRRKSYTTQTVRTCISCQSSDSPCWRPSWSPRKHDQLCNSCGLRYKKTHTRCLNEVCKKIPTKGELNIMKSHGVVTDAVKGCDDLFTGYRCLFCNSITETKESLK